MSISLRSLLMSLRVTSAAVSESPREILWDKLVPEDWNPYAVFDELSDEEYEALSDEEFYALEVKVEEMLVKAPVVAELDGEKVRIPGFILPLEYEGTRIREFLVLPSRGACIHTPPPPSNQIIRGNLEQAYELREIWHPVWVTGRLRTGYTKLELAEEGYNSMTDVSSSYSMDVELIEAYTMP